LGDASIPSPPRSTPPPPLRGWMRLQMLYKGIHKKPTLATPCGRPEDENVSGRELNDTPFALISYAKKERGANCVSVLSLYSVTYYVFRLLYLIGSSNVPAKIHVPS
jgi:hypothetical protein